MGWQSAVPFVPAPSATSSSLSRKDAESNPGKWGPPPSSLRGREDTGKEVHLRSSREPVWGPQMHSPNLSAGTNAAVTDAVFITVQFNDFIVRRDRFLQCFKSNKSILGELEVW